MFNVKAIGGDKASGSAAREKSRAVARAGASLRLFYVEVENSGGAQAYLQVFDAASLPSNGTAPTVPAVVIQPNQIGYKVYGAGRPMGLGIVAALSTTKDTLTLVAGNDGWFDIHYA